MKKKTKIVFISGGLILAGLLLKIFNWDHHVVIGLSYFDLLMITASIVAGYQVLQNAYNTLKMKILGIDTLVSLAAIGAIVIGEYWEAAAVTFLFIFGSYLEAKTIGKTRDAIRNLMELSPTTATVIRDGKRKSVRAQEVEKGETVIVKPGEKIPVDGTVLKGESEVNQASITGESVPVHKTEGEEVFSGTMNDNGYLEIKAEKTGSDTTFAQIIEMVEAAQEKKSKTQILMKRFAKYYTPAIIILAAVSFILTGNIRLALTLLVIGCPGALVISTPISIVASIGNAAKNGVLIKGGDYLEETGKIDTVAFDKTGTLTQGESSVIEVIPFQSTRKDVLLSAAQAEANSEHHLAQAILEIAKDEYDFNDNISLQNFSAEKGKGVTGIYKDNKILVGNEKLIEENDIKISQQVKNHKGKLEGQGKSVVIVAKNSKLLGIIAIADPIRKEAAETIKKLKKLGIKKVFMLTGDNEKVARHISNKLNLDEYEAELLPDQKLERIEKHQQNGEKIAMVGDGINDAPSLATANIGIAMGAAGTDVAIDTADITLMADKLDKLPFAIGLSKATTRNIKQNITFAILVVLGLLAGVLGQRIFMASGMLIHVLSVILVIINAMRLLNYKSNNN